MHWKKRFTLTHLCILLRKETVLEQRNQWVNLFCFITANWHNCPKINKILWSMHWSIKDNSTFWLNRFEQSNYLLNMRSPSIQIRTYFCLKNIECWYCELIWKVFADCNLRSCSSVKCVCLMTGSKICIIRW